MPMGPNPCPHCKRMHTPGEYTYRPELATKPLGDLLKGKDGKPYPPGHKSHGVRSGTPMCPPDVHCECGAVLRYVVPIFLTNSQGYEWRRVDAPAKPDPQTESEKSDAPGPRSEAPQG